MTWPEIRSKLMWVAVGAIAALGLAFGLRKKPVPAPKVTKAKVEAALEEERAANVKVQEVPKEDDEVMKAARARGLIK